MRTWRCSWLVAEKPVAIARICARIAVNAHTNGSAQTEKAGSEVRYESLNVEHGGGRVLVALVDVYVVAIDKNHSKFSCPGSVAWLSAVISCARALKSSRESSLTAASNTHETSVLMSLILWSLLLI